MMGPAYAHLGDFERAFACYSKARAADADSKFVDSLQAMTLALAGKREDAVVMLAEISRRAMKEYISPVSIAYVCTALGDRNGAFENLDRAIFDRDPNVVGLTSNPIFDSLREDDRYRALVRKMQLEA
jgi:tetratricopeptide (TPR) repeat protein